MNAPHFVRSLIASMCLFSFTIQAQSLPPFKVQDSTFKPVTLSAFLAELSEKNVTIKTRKLSSDTALSIAEQAGMPRLSPILTYARGSMYTQAPYSGYSNPASNTLGATVTIEGWGKRSAREVHARAEANRQMAEMVNESRSVETQAIFNYIDALRTKLLWQSYQSALDRLSAFRSDDTAQYKAEFLMAQKVLGNDLKFYSYGLMNYLNEHDHQLPLPVGSLNIEPQDILVKNLIAGAQQSRTDLLTNKASIESASSNLELVKANRNIDFLPGIYYNQTPPYSTLGQPYGAQQSVTFLLSIPLGNGMVDDSEVITAANSLTEQELNLASTKTKIVTEINQTYLQYESTKDRLQKANLAYKQASSSKNSTLGGLLKFRDAEYELIDARTVHAKTLIQLQRLGGNFEVPNLN
jgi:outer membrane protein TolC